MKTITRGAGAQTSGVSNQQSAVRETERHKDPKAREPESAKAFSKTLSPPDPKALKVLVTGATGFIGSYLAQELSKHCTVIGVSRSALSKIKGSIQMISADLSKELDLPPVDVIVHTAAQSPGPGVKAEDFVRSNIIAVQNLIKCAKKANVKKFIHLSSISIYGDVYAKVLDESTPITNPGIYGITKYAAELLLKNASADFPVIALRMPGVLGKGAKTPWLAGVLKSAKEGKNITIFNPDEKFNNIVYLPDLAQFIETLLKTSWSGFEAVNLGCAEPLSVRETVKLIINESGSRSKIIETKEKKLHFTVSYEKAKRLFGYRPSKASGILRNYVKLSGENLNNTMAEGN